MSLPQERCEEFNWEVDAQCLQHDEGANLRSNRSGDSLTRESSEE